MATGHPLDTDCHRTSSSLDTAALASPNAPLTPPIACPCPAGILVCVAMCWQDPAGECRIG